MPAACTAPSSKMKYPKIVEEGLGPLVVQTDQAEQGGVRPVADREREDRRGGERLVRGEEPQRVAKMHHRGTSAMCPLLRTERVIKAAS
jgi:hypothetical protein